MTKRKVYNQDGHYLGDLRETTKTHIIVSNKIGFSFDVRLERVKFSGLKIIVMDRA